METQTQDLQNQTYTPPTEFTFNFQRLIKEVDTLVQDRTDKSKSELATSLSTSLRDINHNIEAKKNEFGIFYNTTVQSVLANIKGDLIAEIAKGRTQINIGENHSFTVTHQDHPQFETIISDLVLFHKVMLVGKAGK